MGLLLLGFVLMLGGVAALFGMMTGAIPSGLFLSLAAFVATVAGIACGLAGILRRFQPPPG